MNDRERFIACVLGQAVDRPPYWLYWTPWPTARERWLREGMPQDLPDHRALFEADAPPRAIAVNCGPCPRIAQVVLQETEDDRVHVDIWGIVRRDLKHYVLCRGTQEPDRLVGAGFEGDSNAGGDSASKPAPTMRPLEIPRPKPVKVLLPYRPLFPLPQLPDMRLSGQETVV